MTTISQYQKSAGYASYSREAIDNIARNTGQLVHRTATKARDIAFAFTMGGATTIVPVGGGRPIAVKIEGATAPSGTMPAPPVGCPAQLGDDDSEEPTSLFEPAVMSVKQGLHARERAMLEADFHKRMLHLGTLRMDLSTSGIWRRIATRLASAPRAESAFTRSVSLPAGV